MNCAAFEAELKTLLEEPDAETDRTARAARLKEHAAGCQSCAGSVDLLEWILLPASERDPLDEPDEAYWETFESRLRERILRVEAESAARTRRRLSAVAAAALVGVALVAAWFLRPGEPRRWVDGDESSPVLPEALVEALARTDPVVAAQEIEVVAGSAEEWAGDDALFALGAADGETRDEGWLFPSTDDLDAESRRRLLDWLRAQDSENQGGPV